MARYNIGIVAGLILLINYNTHASEYHALENNNRKASSCIRGATCCAAVMLGLTVFAIIKTSGGSGSNGPHPVLCEHPAKMLGYKGLTDITGCWSLSIDCMKYYPFENILPADAFHVGKFNGNNTAAQLYAQELIRKNCRVIRDNPNSCGFCFQSSDTCNIDNLFESKVYELRDSGYCMNEKSTRAALARLNVTQNRTRQSQHQKQNFRQHMRGKSKKG